MDGSRNQTKPQKVNFLPLELSEPAQETQNQTSGEARNTEPTAAASSDLLRVLPNYTLGSTR